MRHYNYQNNVRTILDLSRISFYSIILIETKCPYRDISNKEVIMKALTNNKKSTKTLHEMSYYPFKVRIKILVIWLYQEQVGGSPMLPLVHR